jgi:hypothetical protein
MAFYPFCSILRFLIILSQKMRWQPYKLYIITEIPEYPASILLDIFLTNSFGLCIEKRKLGFLLRASKYTSLGCKIHP